MLAITKLLVATVTLGSTSCLMLAITTLLVDTATLTLGKVCTLIIDGTSMFAPHETKLRVHLIGGVKLGRTRSAALPADRIRLL
jgi:hypothetical protein